MTDLKAILKDCYSGHEDRYSYMNRSMQHPCTLERDLVVPVSFSDTFELPTFLLDNFMPYQFMSRREDFAFAVTLKSNPRMSRYKSLDAVMRNTLSASFATRKLQCIVEDVHDSSQNYYATQGTIFDYAFNPIMMLLWQVKAEIDEDNNLKFRFLKPILKVAPHVLIQKADNVQRYIINKIIPAALEITWVHKPICLLYHEFVDTDCDNHCSVKVEIDKMPFLFKETDTPSVSTTNEMLLDIALNHVEEAVV